MTSVRRLPLYSKKRPTSVGFFFGPCTTAPVRPALLARR
ncbi:hypothetical protein APV28_0754 [Comamonas testosteroni]|nr:hypothetical protein APV28_0754 [Comamonas testosteroni]